MIGHLVCLRAIALAPCSGDEGSGSCSDEGEDHGDKPAYVRCEADGTCCLDADVGEVSGEVYVNQAHEGVEKLFGENGENESDHHGANWVGDDAIG